MEEVGDEGGKGEWERERERGSGADAFERGSLLIDSVTS